jgi:hypothetical protein
MKEEPEDLGIDKNGDPSSQSLYKTRPRRGLRHPEKGGRWIYISGYVWGERGNGPGVNNSWATKLTKLGHRVGKLFREDCTEYYFFVSDDKK